MVREMVTEYSSQSHRQKNCNCVKFYQDYLEFKFYSLFHNRVQTMSSFYFTLIKQ